MTITKVEYQSAKPHIKQVDGFPDFINKIEFTYLAHKTITTTTAEGVAHMTQQMLSTCTYSDPSTSDYDSSNPYIGVSSFTQSKVSGMFSVAYADNKTTWDQQINDQFAHLLATNGTTGQNVEEGKGQVGVGNFNF